MTGSSKKTVRTLLIVLCSAAVLLIACGVYIWVNVSKIWEKPDFESSSAGEYQTDSEASGLPEATYHGGEVQQVEHSNDVIDILLIGVDNRESGHFSGLSDVMIYLRINRNNNTLKLASFMRDTLVPVEGHGKNKLNSAYSFGGIDLIKKTFKENFGFAPDYYMVVNFYGMEDIINGLGGVDIDLDRSELESLNTSISEINSLDKGKDSGTIETSGLHHLNGRQAVAYMRIRHPGGDADRIGRQQRVLSQLFSKAGGISISQLPGLIGSMIQYVRTDIPLNRVVEIAGIVKGMEAKGLNKFRYPEDYESGSYKGMSIVQPKDFETELKKLQDFLKN